MTRRSFLGTLLAAAGIGIDLLSGRNLLKFLVTDEGPKPLVSRTWFDDVHERILSGEFDNRPTLYVFHPQDWERMKNLFPEAQA